MAEEKTYLNVPYAQKDAAKALGAKWDAAQKKWYVPVNKDIELFTRWQPQTTTSKALLSNASRSISSVSSFKKSPAANNASSGVITYATDQDFVAYNGEEPPWV